MVYYFSFFYAVSRRETAGDRERERKREREKERKREKDGVGLLDASRRVGPDCEREVREGRERVRAAEQGAEW